MDGARESALGRHQGHLVVLAVWLAVVVAVLVVDHLRERRRNPDQLVEMAPIRTGPVSMATWPPPRTNAAMRHKRAPRDDKEVGRRWLALVGVSSLTAAGVHLWVMPEHFKESWLYGTFFLVLATAQVGFALLVALHPLRSLLRAGSAANLAVVVLWAYTRLVEVPIGPGRGRTETVGALDIIATTAELLVVIGCIAALLKVRRSRPASPASRQLPVGVTAVP